MTSRPQSFVDFSAALTGFSPVILRGTGMTQAYLQKIDVDCALRACSIAFSPAFRMRRRIRLGRDLTAILDDPDLGPVARNDRVLWYCGAWTGAARGLARPQRRVAARHHRRRLQRRVPGRAAVGGRRRPPGGRAPAGLRRLVHRAGRARLMSTAAPSDVVHDVVVVGAGVAGSLVAKRLTCAGLPRAGARGRTGDRRGPSTATPGTSRPSSPPPARAPSRRGRRAVGAPQPDTRDVRAGDGYFVQNGPLPLRQHLHPGPGRLDAALARRLAADAARGLRSAHPATASAGTGRWTTPTLEPYYRQAEYEIGVAADVADQTHHGVEFAPGYDYPMQRIPPSYSDAGAGRRGRRHGDHGRRRSRSRSRSAATRPPATRCPRDGYRPGRRRRRTAGRSGARPRPRPALRRQHRLHADLPDPGQVQRRQVAGPGRPGQARGARPGRRPARSSSTRSAAQVTGVEYQRYDDPDSPRHTVHVARGRDVRARRPRGRERQADAGLRTGWRQRHARAAT